MSNSITIYGQEVAAELGAYILPDGWTSGTGNNLEAATFQGADFKLPSGRYADVYYHVNIKVTGRTIQKTSRLSRAVRVQIEWVRDGEPNEFSNGWMAVR